MFETDQFLPLIELGEELSGARYGAAFESDRALRILADHARAMTFLLADGVVPSNEDRGYVLRRVMRRAIQQGLALELAPGFLARYAARVRELMGAAYPELVEQAEPRSTCGSPAEEEGFGRTLAQGMAALRPTSTTRAQRPAPRRPGGRRLPPARHVRLPVRDDRASCSPKRGLRSRATSRR